MVRTEESPYILTVDNGENWVIGSKPMDDDEVKENAQELLSAGKLML
jgi:hypothetical protein